MSKSWILGKLPEFVRDLFRNFCQASKALEEEFSRHDEQGHVEFEILRDLVGHEMDKGLLWRMKDTAHHVFRNDPENPLVGRFLDWGMGYIFHETIKLKEDSYQRRNYAPWFKELQAGDLLREEKDIAAQLVQVLNQTEESIAREIARIRFIMTQCRRLLPIYLSRHRDNALLARFVFSQNELVRQVFGGEYDDLIRSIYGNKPEMLYVLAGRSLRLGGWVDEASRAVGEALKINPDEKIVLQEKKIIDNWAMRINA